MIEKIMNYLFLLFLFLVKPFLKLFDKNTPKKKRKKYE